MASNMLSMKAMVHPNIVFYDNKAYNQTVIYLIPLLLGLRKAEQELCWNLFDCIQMYERLGVKYIFSIDTMQRASIGIAIICQQRLKVKSLWRRRQAILLQRKCHNECTIWTRERSKFNFWQRSVSLLRKKLIWLFWE